MKIINNYDGSSIDIEQISSDTNTAYLRLVEENGKACHYYNFIADNSSSQEGFAYIKNLNESMYYSKNSFSPFINKNGDWEKLDSSKYELNDSEIKFLIEPNSKVEISLVPRYTCDDLIDFCNSHSIKYNESELIKIDLGNNSKPTIFVIGRQHPGETLSSFFIEGMVEKVMKDDFLKSNYHFQFYPIVNKKGVKNGNHRYANGVDFNRSWGLSNPPEELKYLQEELSIVNDLAYFIDVHNDELTAKDYIRMNKPDKNEIAGIQVLETMGSFKRFIRALIKQRKIINLSQKTAREYVEKKYNCKSMLIELSMNDEFNSLPALGGNFISEICK